MGFYDDLIAGTGPDRDALLAAPALRAGVNGEVPLSAYQAFLSQAFHHVRHTVPLLMSCGASMPERNAWLRPAVARYIEEEIGHEEWILSDIAATGADSEAIRHSRPHPATELMVAYAYDTIQRRNPLGFFGMVLVLEGTSVGFATTAADAIQGGLNLPDTAFTYLRSHGALDQEHMRFFADLMDQVEDSTDRADILHCAGMFYRLYGDVFRALPIN
jgi:pyrroloquinoline quinone (PQQ) biosynthesis protein C